MLDPEAAGLGPSATPDSLGSARIPQLHNCILVSGEVGYEGEAAGAALCVERWFGVALPCMPAQALPDGEWVALGCPSSSVQSGLFERESSGALPDSPC